MEGHHFEKLFRSKAISESDAAKILGVSEQTLRLARLRGMKRRQHAEIEYSAAALDTWIHQKRGLHLGSIA